MRNRLGFVAVLAVSAAIFCSIASPVRSQFIESHNYKISYVVNQKQVDYVVNVFRKGLLALDPKADIVGCMNVTKVARDGARDFGVGAACTVRTENGLFSLLLCEDSRFGRLSYAESKTPARTKVIDFIEGNCLPAGKTGLLR